MDVMHCVKSDSPNNGKQESKTAQAEAVEERRARRMEALKKVAGLWSEREDIPADGLEYQRQMRAEWR